MIIDKNDNDKWQIDYKMVAACSDSADVYPSRPILSECLTFFR